MVVHSLVGSSVRSFHSMVIWMGVCGSLLFGSSWRHVDACFFQSVSCGSYDSFGVPVLSESIGLQFVYFHVGPWVCFSF